MDRGQVPVEQIPSVYVIAGEDQKDLRCPVAYLLEPDFARIQ